MKKGPISRPPLVRKRELRPQVRRPDAPFCPDCAVSIRLLDRMDQPRMRIVVLLLLGVTLTGCASGGVVGEVLPTSLGGMPKGVPPRPGTPEYEAYRKQLEGQTKVAQPAPSGVY
jgi:hypothetical protein